MFSKEEEQQIVAAIQAAESKTSGEIVLHLEKSCSSDPIERARYWFQKLNLQQTELRNGVLILLIEKQQRFAIYGDQGIHEHVAQKFWDEQSLLLAGDLRHGRKVEGLVALIGRVGEQLGQYFPHTNVDKNELSNDVSYS